MAPGLMEQQNLKRGHEIKIYAFKSLITNQCCLHVKVKHFTSLVLCEMQIVMKYNLKCVYLCVGGICVHLSPKITAFV